MIRTSVLGEAVGIQWSGLTDKTETNSQTGLGYPLLIGQFKRGRTDKPMTVTSGNIKALLGYDPTNKDYIAVQAYLDTKVPSVQVLRIGSGIKPISCVWRTLDAGINYFVLNYDNNLIANCGGVASDYDLNTFLSTQQHVLDSVDRLQSAKAHIYINRDKTGQTFNNTVFAGTFDMSQYITGLRQYVVDNYQEYADNWGYMGYKPFPLKSPIASLPDDLKVIIAQLDTLAGDGAVSQFVDLWFEINSYNRSDSKGNKQVFTTFTAAFRTYSPQRSSKIAYIDTVLESCLKIDETHQGYAGYSVNLNGKIAYTTEEYAALSKSENVLIAGEGTVSALTMTNGGFMTFG